MENSISWAAIEKSNQLAMIMYWHILERGEEMPMGLHFFLNSIQDKVTVYDVPLSVVQKE